MILKLAWLATPLLLACFHLAEAQQPTKGARIAVVTGSTLTALRFRAEAFLKGMQELGWTEGQNISIEYRSADGDTDKLTRILRELISQNLKLIVATSDAVALTALKLTKSTPIVMMAIAADPVETGLVSSLASPGGNVTGVTAIYQNLTGRQLELLKEAFPHIRRVAVFWNPAVVGSAHGFKQLQEATHSVGVRLHSIEITKADDIDRAFAGISRSLDALLVVSDPLTNSHRVRIASLAAKRRVPAVYGARSWVEDGGLMSYGTDLLESARRSAVYVDKILKGSKPAELPVEQPTKFELVINLKTAKQIGLTIPPNVLARADRVIK